MLKRSLLVLGAAVAVYFGAYALARGTHVITHFSNCRHWHPEKRDANHTVGAAYRKYPWIQAIHLLFTPLRCLEERYHNWVHASGRCGDPPSVPGTPQETTAPKGAR